MIVYHPGYDAHHCAYRMINILNSVENMEASYDALKLIDFYYVYPHLLKKVGNLPRPLSRYKEKIYQIEEPFEITPNIQSLYFELRTIQETVISSLSQKLLVTFSNKNVKLNLPRVPQALLQSFKEDEFNKTDIFEILTSGLTKVHLGGKNGFKARSGLMEYRYD